MGWQRGSAACRWHGTTMKMNPEQIDNEDEDEDPEQISEAKSR